MKYAIVSRKDSKSEQLKKAIMSKLPFEYDEVDPDYVLSLGGDGTILRAVHKYSDIIDKVIFFGINTGKLGFYTDWQVDEIDKMCDIMINKGYDIETHSLLEWSSGDKYGYAINEVAIINPKATQVVDVFIGDNKLETCRCTGLCISTTNGSTAFNKSLGGPVVDPKLDAFILSEIAGINSNAYRSLGSPLVLSSNHILELRCHTSFSLTSDQLQFDFPNNTSIKCWLSGKKIKFASSNKTLFIERIKKAFL